jgi:hypothetical protein
VDVAAIKRNFFDKAAVTKGLDPAIRKALSKFGAFVRTRARSSLKYRTGASAAGSPPSVHRSKGFTRKKKVKGAVVQQPSSPLRELLFFSYDPEVKSVVIGPAIGGSRSDAPRIEEEGGTTTINVGGKRVSASYPARPYMGPAFATERAKAAELFRGLIR